MKISTVREFRDKTTGLLRSKTPILVTRRGRLAGIFFPRPELAKKKRLRLDTLLLTLAALPVTVVEPSEYEHQLTEAERRMGKRDPDDVDVLSAAAQREAALSRRARGRCLIVVRKHRADRPLDHALHRRQSDLGVRVKMRDHDADAIHDSRLR